MTVLNLPGNIARFTNDAGEIAALTSYILGNFCQQSYRRREQGNKFVGKSIAWRQTLLLNV